MRFSEEIYVKRADFYLAVNITLVEEDTPPILIFSNLLDLNVDTAALVDVHIDRSQTKKLYEFPMTRSDLHLRMLLVRKKDGKVIQLDDSRYDGVNMGISTISTESDDDDDDMPRDVVDKIYWNVNLSSDEHNYDHSLSIDSSGSILKTLVEEWDAGNGLSYISHFQCRFILLDNDDEDDEATEKETNRLLTRIVRMRKWT